MVNYICTYMHVYLHGERRSADGSERSRYACENMSVCICDYKQTVCNHTCIQTKNIIYKVAEVQMVCVQRI